jgi:CheY-like chemotaxis protein
VDDDRKIVRLVCSYLEQAGMTVLTAYDGDTAMHVIRRERPDLIVLDLMLPGRDVCVKRYALPPPQRVVRNLQIVRRLGRRLRADDRPGLPLVNPVRRRFR